LFDILTDNRAFEAGWKKRIDKKNSS